jgi:hypothetical protein
MGELRGGDGAEGMNTSADAAYDANISDATNSRRHAWRCWDCSRFVIPGAVRCADCAFNRDYQARTYPGFTPTSATTGDQSK